MNRSRTEATRLSKRSASRARVIVSAALAVLLLTWSFPYPVHSSNGDANQAQLTSNPGELDATFGTSGIAITYCPGEDGMVQAVAAQPDGKIVAAGFVESPITPTKLVLARYNANGSLDQSFGTSGMVTEDHFAAFGVTLQPDGKLVVVGMSNGSGPVQVFAVARFNSDGTVDSGFGANGKTLIDFGGVPITDANGVAFAALIQPDGKIVAGGTASKADGKEAIALARYNSNGTLDTSFGTNGKVSTDFSHPNAAARAFGLQADGKILSSGTVGTNPVTWSDFYQPDDPTQDFALARFNPNGSLDTSFGNGGLVTTDFFGYTDGSFAMNIRPNGKIIAAGATVRSWDRDTTDFALIRYNSDGSLDTTFGGTGKVTTDFHSRADLAYALLTQDDGKIIALGSARVWDNSRHEMAVARFNRDGSPDANFGQGGKVTTTNVLGASAYSAAFAADGDIIAGGYGADQWNTDALMLACYNRGALEGDFRVASDREEQALTAGASTTFTVNVESLTQPAVLINLSAEVTPATGSVTTSLTPPTILPGASSTLTVTTSVDTPPGQYAIKVVGTEGEMFRTTNITVTVAGPGFGLSFDSSTVSGSRGTKVKIFVNINRFAGFVGDVTVTPPDLATEGIIAKFPEPYTSSDAVAMWKFKIKGWAAIGPHQLTFTGVDGSGRVRSATVTLVID